jgi:RNA polymerase sigma factor (sigma-70 family)
MSAKVKEEEEDQMIFSAPIYEGVEEVVTQTLYQMIAKQVRQLGWKPTCGERTVLANEVRCGAQPDQLVFIVLRYCQYHAWNLAQVYSNVEFEDIYQEMLLNYIETLPIAFNKYEDVLPYLIRCITGRAIDYCKYTYTIRPPMTDEGGPIFRTERLDAAYDLATPTPLPEKEFTLLYKSIGELCEGHQNAINNHYGLNQHAPMTYEAIAQMMKKSKSTVSTSIRRARQRLEKALAQEYINP